MSLGRTQVNGSFITTSIIQPGAVSSVHTYGGGIKARGNGAMTIVAQTDTGANVSLVLQLSSDVLQTLAFAFYYDTTTPSSTILNQLNKLTADEGVAYSMNIANGAVITKFDISCSGKIESCSMDGGYGGSVARFSPQAMFNSGQLTNPVGDLKPAGWASDSDSYSQAISASGLAGNSGSGLLETQTPGRGHLGVDYTTA